MAEEWISFVNELKDEAGSLAKSELLGLVAATKEDVDPFVRRQAGKTERYLNQLALGTITKEDFVQNMKNIQRLNELQELKLSVEAKVSAQKLTLGIQNLILDKLLKLIL